MCHTLLVSLSDKWYHWSGVAAESLRALDCDQVVLGSNPAAATSLRNFSNFVYPLCQCLSEQTLKAVGPFYLVSIPGEVKDPTSVHWTCSVSWTAPLLEKDNSKNNKFECFTVLEGKESLRLSQL